MAYYPPTKEDLEEMEPCDRCDRLTMRGDLHEMPNGDYVCDVCSDGYDDYEAD